jgi:hypothetical protein
MRPLDTIFVQAYLIRGTRNTQKNEATALHAPSTLLVELLKDLANQIEYSMLPPTKKL